MGLFRNNIIKVEYLKLMWPDENTFDHINSCDTSSILIFDKDGYSSKEFDEANGRDPAGMCVLCKDEKGESHIQNMILGEKAELIYKLLTTPSSEYSIRTCGPGIDYVEIEF